MADPKRSKKPIVSIPEVFDRMTGEFFEAVTFFDYGNDRRSDELHMKRRELTRAKKNGDPILVCAMCQEPVMIAGGLGRTKQRLHFRHYKEGETCPHQSREVLDQETIRKIKYNGAKESKLHKEIKSKLQYWLEKSPLTEGPVCVEKTFFHEDKGREWRRPDIACTWNGRKVVFEVQISSDFLDVIVGREDFYREQGVYIIWVFNDFDPFRFTSKDIYVGNQKNVFLYNEDANKMSISHGHLLMECRYKEPICESGSIVDNWQSQYVAMEGITFDATRMQAFLFDYDAAEKKLIEIHLRKSFENYWCNEKSYLSPKIVLEKNKFFNIEFSKYLAIEDDLLNYETTKVIDALYSIKNASVCNYSLNLYGLIDMIMNCRKAYIFIITWALEIYGHRKNFENRPAFTNKIAEYHKGVREKNPEYCRVYAFDALFRLLFPELAEKI